MRLHLPVVLLLLAACGPARLGGSGEEGGVSSLESTTTSETSSVTSAVTSDNPGDGDGDGWDRDLPDCSGSFEIGPPYHAPNVMFVVDTSSSMRDGWDDDQDPMTPTVTRWSTVSLLFYDVFYWLGPAKCRLGLQRAPSAAACAAATVEDPMCTDADVCLVEPVPEIELGDNQRGEILTALPDISASPLEIVGGSPIREAYLSARDHLLEQPGGLALIVLITDGGASCSEPSLPGAVEIFDDELVPTVADGFEVDGVQTIVVGVGVPSQPSMPAQPDSPAVDLHTALNDLAVAGGRPWKDGMEARKYFDAAAPDDLRLTLERAGCGATSCTVDLAMWGGPIDPFYGPYTQLLSNGQELPRVRNCELEDGWAWATDGEVLNLCGSYCDAYMTCEQEFELEYGFCGE